MAVNTITPKVELRLDNGTWLDLSPWLDNESEMQGNRGRSPDRKPIISTFSFTLDNSGDVWTQANTASAQFGRLRQYSHIRFSSTVSATTRYHFRGVVTSLRSNFVDAGPVHHRVEVSCEGLELLLSLPKSYQGVTSGPYKYSYLENVDIDDAMAAIMTAVGVTDYSFEDSNVVLEYFAIRGRPLDDWLALGDSEMGGERWFDGQGRPRLKKAENMVGGYASPTHTWGSTIAPEGEVVPDMRLDARFASISMEVINVEPDKYLLPGQGRVVWEYAARNGPEKLAPYAERRFVGRAEEPVFRFLDEQNPNLSAEFFDSADKLRANITSAATELTTESAQARPVTFREGDQIRIDSEVMQINQVVSIGTRLQVLSVVRGVFGTPAAAHTAGAAIFHRRRNVALEERLLIGTVNKRLEAAVVGTVSTLFINERMTRLDEVNLGDIIELRYGGEEVAVLSLPVVVSPGVKSFSVLRGVRNTPIQVASVGQEVNLKVPKYEESIPGQGSGTSVAGLTVTSSLTPFGTEVQGQIIASPAFAQAATLRFEGQDFEVRVYNQTSQERYLRNILVYAHVFELKETAITVSLQQSIPGIIGDPEGPSLVLPYGVPDVAAAKAYIAGKLRAGRMPSPWLTVTFSANVSDNTTSILTADIGDLVRYTGTGTYREKIDDWFRIAAVSWVVEENDIWYFTFTLEPAHENVLPSKSWFTTFTWQGATGATGLGMFDAAPPGDTGWPAASQWRVFRPLLSEPVNTENFISAPGVEHPTPPLKNITAADMKVAAGVTMGPALQRGYLVDTDGVGVVFRANSTGTEHWWCYFHVNLQAVVLGNTTDGVVDTYDFTIDPNAKPELMVLAQSTKIRVFVEARPEAVIEVTSTRFQGNTYAGPNLDGTILVSGTKYPGIRWFSAQAV